MSLYLALALIAYLIGSIQPAYFLTKIIKKQDIRNIGSKNAGASNAAIILGFKFGVIVALIDILKAVIVIFAMGQYTTDIFWLFFTLFSVIIGHNFPFYLHFKGGKGTASLIGGLLIINWKLALIGVFILVLLTFLTDFIVFGTIGLLGVMVIGTVFYWNELSTILLTILISLLSLYLHRDNMIRILKKEEIGLRSLFVKKSNIGL